jgi:hypothetical protein
MLTNERLLVNEERLHCNAVYHLVRCHGAGSDYVLPLYDLSMIVGGKSGRFFPRLTELASYLNCHRNQLYLAADLLWKSGFWEVLSEVRGKPVEYRPLSHQDWVKVHLSEAEATCCMKAAMPWDGEEQDPLAPLLYGVTGGAQFYPNVLKGWRDKSGLTDEQILERAKEFMQSEEAQKRTVSYNDRIGPKFSHVKGKTFRRRLGYYICNGELSKT